MLVLSKFTFVSSIQSVMPILLLIPIISIALILFLWIISCHNFYVPPFFNITVISCRFPWHSCPFWKLLIPSSFHRVHISFYLLFSPPYHLKQFFFPHQCKFMIDIWLGLFIHISIYTCCHGISLRYSIDDTTFWLSLNVMKFSRKRL